MGTLNTTLSKVRDERKNKQVECPTCHGTFSELFFPIHSWRVHDIRVGADILYQAVIEHPGLTRGEYAGLMNKPYANVQSMTLRLIKVGKIHDEKDASGTHRLHPGPGSTKHEMAPAERASEVGAVIDKATKPQAKIKAVRKATTPSKPAFKKAESEVFGTMQVFIAADDQTYAIRDGKIYRIELIPV